MTSEAQKRDAPELALPGHRAGDAISGGVTHVFYAEKAQEWALISIKGVIQLERVAAYIDGFNLYFGLRQSNWRRYYWLDLPSLVTNILKSDQQLVATHYFTARIRANGFNTDDAKRQNNYIDALATRPNLKTHFGHYLEKTRHCKQCGASWPDYEEKMTDVNIATQLLSDAFDDRFDTAIIISGDSDLTTPIRQVRQRFQGKRLIVAFPPNRHSAQLKSVAHGHLTVGEDKLKRSQLPDTVMTAGAYALQRPMHWN